MPALCHAGGGRELKMLAALYLIVSLQAGKDADEHAAALERVQAILGRLEAGDALTLDYPGQPRDKNGRFATGKMNGGSTTSQESGSTTSQESGSTTSQESGSTTSQESGSTTSQESGSTTSQESGSTTSQESGKIKKPKISAKERARVSSGILTDHPNWQIGESHTYEYGSYAYRVVVNEPGAYTFLSRKKLR